MVLDITIRDIDLGHAVDGGIALRSGRHGGG